MTFTRDTRHLLTDRRSAEYGHTVLAKEPRWTGAIYILIGAMLGVACVLA